MILVPRLGLSICDDCMFGIPAQTLDPIRAICCLLFHVTALVIDKNLCLSFHPGNR